METHRQRDCLHRPPVQALDSIRAWPVVGVGDGGDHRPLPAKQRARHKGANPQIHLRALIIHCLSYQNWLPLPNRREIV
jgi:hypothetical protein